MAKPKEKSKPKAKVQKELHPCACGCKQKCFAEFAPGHDSKLKSRLVAAALAGDSAALSEIKKRGWVHAYEVSKEARAARNGKAKTKAAATKKKAAKPAAKKEAVREEAKELVTA